MLASIFNWLRPPQYADPRINRQARLLNHILWAALITVLGYTLCVPLILADAAYTTYSLIPILGLILLLIAIFRRGYVIPVALIFIVAGWLIITYGMIAFGGIRSASFNSYFVLVMLAGLLLGQRAGIAAAVIAITSSIVVLWMELNGILPAPLSPDSLTSYWFAQAANLILLVVLLGLAISALDTAATTAEEHKNALLRSNRELESSQKSLQLRSEAIAIAYEELQEEISERRRAETALRAANIALAETRDILERRVNERTGELAQANEDLETLLCVISHDLKEPLRSVHNFSRLLATRYEADLDERGQDYIRRTVRAADRLQTLLEDVLTLSRVRRSQEMRQLVPARQLVDQAHERLEYLIATSGAEIEIADALPELYVNPTWATQAIYNLLHNALKYRQNGEPPAITVSGYENESVAGLAIADRGPGIAPEHRERIFQLFQRAVGREIEGTGAGLAITRQIAQRHAGRTWVDARPEGGSIFYITFGKAIRDDQIDTRVNDNGNSTG